MYGAVRESVSVWHVADEAFLLPGRGSMPGVYIKLRNTL